MGNVVVKVVPRSGRRSVELTPRGVVIRVRSAPEDGRATDEARRALAEALGVSPSEVSLRKGRRSRQKVFDIDGLSEAEVRSILG